MSSPRLQRAHVAAPASPQLARRAPGHSPLAARALAKPAVSGLAAAERRNPRANSKNSRSAPTPSSRRHLAYTRRSNDLAYPSLSCCLTSSGDAMRKSISTPLSSRNIKATSHPHPTRAISSRTMLAGPSAWPQDRLPRAMAAVQALKWVGAGRVRGEDSPDPVCHTAFAHLAAAAVAVTPVGFPARIRVASSDLHWELGVHARAVHLSSLLRLALLTPVTSAP